MTTEIATRSNSADIMEQVLLVGDLAKLTPAQRVTYYNRVCESLGLNPLTKPFLYVTLNGQLRLYATKDAGDQLRKRDAVSIGRPDVQFDEGLCVVTVTATLPNGRTDSELGVVTIEGLKGDNRANAIMKAVTKAKRRVTLSIVGLGWLDETETETIAGARPVEVNAETGEILEPASGVRSVDSGRANEEQAPDVRWDLVNLLKEHMAYCMDAGQAEEISAQAAKEWDGLSGDQQRVLKQPLADMRRQFGLPLKAS